MMQSLVRSILHRAAAARRVALIAAASLPLADRFLYSPVLPGSFDIENGVEP